MATRLTQTGGLAWMSWLQMRPILAPLRALVRPRYWAPPLRSLKRPRMAAVTVTNCRCCRLQNRRASEQHPHLTVPTPKRLPLPLPTYLLLTIPLLYLLPPTYLLPLPLSIHISLTIFCLPTITNTPLLTSTPTPALKPHLV